MKKPPPNPLLAAWEGWLLGSAGFVKRIQHLVRVPKQPDQVPRSRRFVNLNAEEVMETVANYFGVASTAYAARRSTAAGRDLAAYLAHRRTTSTLRELATFLGLTHPDSMSHLTRRADKSIAESTTARKHIKQILAVLDKT